MRMLFHTRLILMYLQVSLPVMAAHPDDSQPTEVIVTQQLFDVGLNDTVWGIASTIAVDEIDVNRVMRLLFEQNPEQFIKGDIHRLKKGGVLTLVSSDSSSLPEKNSLPDVLLRTASSSDNVSKKDPLKTHGLNVKESTQHSRFTIDDKANSQDASSDSVASQLSLESRAALNQALAYSKSKTAELAQQLAIVSDELTLSEQRVVTLESTLRDKKERIEALRNQLILPVTNSANNHSVNDPIARPKQLYSAYFIALVSCTLLAILVIFVRLARFRRMADCDAESSVSVHGGLDIDTSASVDTVDQSTDEHLDKTFEPDTSTNNAIFDKMSQDTTVSDSFNNESKVPLMMMNETIFNEQNLPETVSIGVGRINDTATQLELSRVYIDMGDFDGARKLLAKILKTANAKQLEIANSLIGELDQLS